MAVLESLGCAYHLLAIHDALTMKCWLSKVGVIALRNVVGKEVVETMSPEFVDFIQEAYQRLRWGEK